MARRQSPPATPGEILLEEFLKPLGVTQYRLAKEIGVPQACEPCDDSPRNT
jgi:plasmid maintenance system antidote protein VapI